MGEKFVERGDISFPYHLHVSLSIKKETQWKHFGSHLISPPSDHQAIFYACESTVGRNGPEMAEKLVELKEAWVAPAELQP